VRTPLCRFGRLARPKVARRTRSGGPSRSRVLVMGQKSKATNWAVQGGEVFSAAPQQCKGEDNNSNVAQHGRSYCWQGPSPEFGSRARPQPPCASGASCGRRRGPRDPRPAGGRFRFCPSTRRRESDLTECAVRDGQGRRSTFESSAEILWTPPSAGAHSIPDLEGAYIGRDAMTGRPAYVAGGGLGSSRADQGEMAIRFGSRQGRGGGAAHRLGA